MEEGRSSFVVRYMVLSDRLTADINEWGDFISIDPEKTTADLTKVWVKFDDSAFWFRLSDVYDTEVYFKRISLKWDSSQVGRTLVLIIGREYRFRRIRGAVTIASDTAGLAKDDTVRNLLPKDSSGNIKVDNANYEVMAPSDIQAVYKDKAVLYSGTVTSSGNSADINVSNFGVLEIELKVTSVSGTSPTLSVYIEGKFEDSGDYKPLVYQEGITGTGAWFFTITKLAFRYIRVRWVVGGTSPSFTFGVYAQMLVL
jgi:hypothetical protein